MSTYLAGLPPAARPMEPIRPSPAPARVAWGLVTSCASAMVLADAFLVVALRGVAGSIERTDHLFLAWIRESMLLLPAFVVAVLLAVTWAQRRWRATSVMIGSIALAGTLAGQLWATISAVYDFRLQQHELLDLPAMRLPAPAPAPHKCSTRQSHSREGPLAWRPSRSCRQPAGSAMGLRAAWWRARAPAPEPGGAPAPVARPAPRANHRPAVGDDGKPSRRCRDPRGGRTRAPEGVAASWSLFRAPCGRRAGRGHPDRVRHSSKTVAVVALLSVLPLALWVFSRTHGVPFGPRAGVPETIGSPTSPRVCSRWSPWWPAS